MNLEPQEIRKGKGNLKIGKSYRLIPSLPFKNYFLEIAVKTYAKADTKSLWSCPIFLDFRTFSKIFCH